MRGLARLAAASAAVPFLLAAAPAYADDVTLSGCWGAGVVVCDVTVEYGELPGVERYTTTVPVCAGTCTYVPVTLYRLEDIDSWDVGPVCVTYDTNLTSPTQCDVES